MRDIIMAVILGNALGMSLMSGAESINDGGGAWILQLIVFPLAAVAGIVSLLLAQRKKRVPASGRHPNPQEPEPEEEPEPPR